MADLRDVIQARIKTDEGFENTRKIVTCVMAGVDSSTDPAVSGRSGYVWVRELGADTAFFQVDNRHREPLYDMVLLDS